MRKILHYIIIVLVLSGCSPQKRLARLLDRHPELMEQREKEITITHTDTAYIAGDSATVTFDLSLAKGEAAAHDGRSTIAQVDAVRSSATLTLLDPDNDIFALSVETKPDTVTITHTDTLRVKEVVYKTEKEFVNKDLSWADKMALYSGRLLLIVLFILICVYVIKRFI